MKPFSARLIQRSNICTALDPKTWNLRAWPLKKDGKPVKELIFCLDQGKLCVPGQTYWESIDGRPAGFKKWNQSTKPAIGEVYPGANTKLLHQIPPVLNPPEETPPEVQSPNINEMDLVQVPLGTPPTNMNGDPIDLMDSLYDSLGT